MKRISVGSRGTIAFAGLIASATMFAACGGSSTPGPAQQDGTVEASVQAVHVRDSLLATPFVAPAGFSGAVVREVPVSDSDRKEGTVAELTISFDSPTAAGVTVYVFNSAAAASDFGRDFATIQANKGTGVASAIPGAICADSPRYNGVCGLQTGLVFITTSSAEAAQGAVPLLASAKTAIDAAS